MKKLILMVALMMPVALMAQEKKESAIAIPQSEKTLNLAAELSKHGYATHDALSLIQAARLSKQAGFVQEERKKEGTEGTAAATDESKKQGQVSLDPAKLLADAKSWAAEDGVLLALIEDVNSNVRGAVGGSKYAVERVEAGATDVYTIMFRAGEQATVVVIGDGDTDLDLYIYDSNGNLIDSDIDDTDNCVCSWTPRWTGNFKIKIKNHGAVYNRYVLRTN